MNRNTLFCLLLTLTLLFMGCTQNEPVQESAVTFYYLSETIAFGTADGVIAEEQRPDENMDISAALELYLQGPLSTGLQSPFPVGLSLADVQFDGEHLCVTLSDDIIKLTDMELTLACSCLAKTCFGLGEYKEVRIFADGTTINGANYLSFRSDSVLLSDESGY